MVFPLRRLALGFCAGGKGEKLNCTELAVVNPPYGFAEDARSILAFLASRLAQGEGAEFIVEELTGE